MKLYYAPGACSLSPHIALVEAGLPHQLKRVDLKAKKLADGSDFLAVNPKGYVPVLELDDGQRLTEGPAIVQYVADRAPQSGLAPAAGTFERYRLQEWLGFVNSEIHKTFGPLWNAKLAPEARQVTIDQLARRLDFVSNELGRKPWLMGERFTVADAYLFTVLNWGQWTGVDLAKWPVLAAYHARVAARPGVIEAMRAEGLVRERSAA